MKLITGCWFEFRHHSAAEGLHYNPSLHDFTGDQWRAMISDMAELSMDTLVLTCSSLAYADSAESYAPVTVFPQSDMVCPNAMDILMEEAARLHLSVYLSVGFYGNWVDPVGNMRSAEVEERAKTAAQTLYAAYASNPAFAGWYLPDETEAGPYFAPVFMDYAARYCRFLRAIDPAKKILIAPYGTNKIVPDETFVEQLRQLDVDYIAYQDEVGVEKSTAEQTGGYYQGLRKAHDLAGRSHLWCDMEVFAFEGQVYKSALLPAPIERIEQQMRAVSPHVEKILCYAYPGLMARPGSAACYGDHHSPEKLYADYQALARACRDAENS